MGILTAFASIGLEAKHRLLFEESLKLTYERDMLQNALDEYDQLAMLNTQGRGILANKYSSDIAEYRRKAADLRRRATEAGISYWRISLLFPSETFLF
jgi:hypothetical protein